MKHALSCGAASRIITPPPELLPFLRGNMGMEFNAVLDDLYLRVIALDNGETRALLICLEANYPCTQEILEQLSRKTGAPTEHILFMETHVHAAPMYQGSPLERISNPRKHVNRFSNYPQEVQAASLKYIDFISKYLFEAAEDAIQTLRPARMGFSVGESCINVQRNQLYSAPDGAQNCYSPGAAFDRPADRTLYAIRFEDMKGKPIAFLINYAVHNCVMIFNHSGQNGKSAISSDISGRACRFLEQEFEGSVALWCSGAAGDLNPVMGNELLYPDPCTGACTQWNVQGPELAEAALTVLSARHYSDILRTLRQISHYTEQLSLRGKVEWSRTPGIDEQEHVIKDLYQVRMQMLLVGSLALFGVSGELFSSYANLIRQTSPFRHTIIINHNVSGLAASDYIYDDEAFRHSPGLVQSPEDAMPPSSMEGGIVAIRHSQMVPGYFADSLKKHIQSLSDALLS